MESKLGAIILAAGKGTRMGAKKINKVAMPLADKPMITHTIELLEKLDIKRIVVVVGFAKKSVMGVLGQKVLFATQKKRLGTAHALLKGLEIMPRGTENILVLNGDDSAFYTREIISELILKHFSENSQATLLTIQKKDPHGLGRIVKDKSGKLLAIVEEKDATEKQREINEVNPGCYVFRSDFLNSYLPKVKKSQITGEYYLTSLIDIGIKNAKDLHTLPVGKIAWRGVNTHEELEEAQRLFTKIK